MALLAATAWTLGTASCTPMPPEIVAVDSGVNVNPDMVIPITTTELRFGNFVTGAGPVDLCIKGAQDPDFVGPVMRNMAGRPGGVPYLSVGMYLTLKAGSYTVKAVPGIRTDCTVSYGGLKDLVLPPLGGGRTYTLIPFGDQNRPATVKINLFEDDRTAQGGQARMRFLNVSPDVPTADFGFGTGASYKALLSDALSGDLGRAGGMTILTIAPQTGSSASVRPSGMTTDLLTVNSTINIPAGAVITSLIAGLPSRASTDPLSLKLVFCDDSKPAQSGLSICTQLN